MTSYLTPTKVYNNSYNMSLGGILDSVWVSLGVVIYDVAKGRTDRIMVDMSTLLVSDYLSKISMSAFGNVIGLQGSQYQFLVKSGLTGILNSYGQIYYADEKLPSALRRSFLENFAIGAGSSYLLGMWNNPLSALLGI